VADNHRASVRHGLRRLGLRDRNDAMTELVAEKIIELAQCGYKNPTALHLAVMTEFKSNPQ
jgi:hypothetical protein